LLNDRVINNLNVILKNKIKNKTILITFFYIIISFQVLVLKFIMSINT